MTNFQADYSRITYSRQLKINHRMAGKTRTCTEIMRDATLFLYNTSLSICNCFEVEKCDIGDILHFFDAKFGQMAKMEYLCRHQIIQKTKNERRNEDTWQHHLVDFRRPGSSHWLLLWQPGLGMHHHWHSYCTPDI